MSIVYRPKLERRLTSLEKKLNLDAADRHTSEAKLLRPVSVSFEGVRVCHRAASLKLDRTGRNTVTPATGRITRFLSPIKPDRTKVEEISVSGKGETVSSWLLDGNTFFYPVRPANGKRRRGSRFG